MKPLVDCDILLYEIGYSGEFKDEEGEVIINSFDNVAELFDKKIALICDEVEATEKPTLYITADEKLVNQLLKCPLPGVSSPSEWAENFRIGVATTKGYKATRKSSKPFHFYNLRAYVLATYNCVVSCGWEADDQMAMDQCANLLKTTELAKSNWETPKGWYETVICTRDKDLRMVPGWHYSWECGKQASMGPTYVDGPGWLEEKDDGKIIGYGPLFFYYQLLVGDTVDNIPGCKGIGPKAAFPALIDVMHEREMFEIVREFYVEKHPDNTDECLLEQAHLLWMVQKLDEDGQLVMWEPPYDRY